MPEWYWIFCSRRLWFLSSAQERQNLIPPPPLPHSDSSNFLSLEGLVILCLLCALSSKALRLYECASRQQRLDVACFGTCRRLPLNPTEEPLQEGRSVLLAGKARIGIWIGFPPAWQQMCWRAGVSDSMMLRKPVLPRDCPCCFYLWMFWGTEVGCRLTDIDKAHYFTFPSPHVRFSGFS